ncbi:MAG TPA: cation-translocating P-type ATPase [Candidatus Obscuribacterales bacterium]
MRTRRLQPPTVAAVTRLVTVAAAIVALWLTPSGRQPWPWIGLAAVAICGYPIYKEALTSLLKLRMSMELSMTIALVAALAIGETFTSLVIMFFVLVAEELEHLTVQRGRTSIAGLLDLLPKQALVKIDGQFTEVKIEAVRRGDVVLVKPGARIVVDGVVESGDSFVDESAITGESFPVEKLPGHRVYAGTINQSGALEVVAEKIGADTAFGKIVNAVENAERSKAGVQRLADQLAGYLVMFAIAAAGLTYLITWDVTETISVVIVAGACGIAAGTPLALLGSIGQAAKRGSIIKGGKYLEALAQIDTVVFDKTGTLTSGQPHVASVQSFNGHSTGAVLRAAARAEVKSEHPLARAIMRRAEELKFDVTEPANFDYVPGRGIRADGCHGEILVGNRALMESHGVRALPAESNKPSNRSQVLVSCNGQLVGIIEIADTLRPEARQAVAALKSLGIRSVLLTGDAKAVARSVATQLDIDEHAAELQPEDKRAWVSKLQADGHRTAMVGDGINDAPALTEAAVGVAIGSGTDVALESAGVVLIGNDLMRFVDAVKIARRCRRVIWFNFAGTIAVDAVGMCLAFLGVLNPLLAALVHVGSELAFILNSARLFPLGRDPKDDGHCH